MGVLVDVGRAALAAVVKERPLYAAWGNGDPSWDTVPAVESMADTALVSELGRVACAKSDYAVPDESGTIIVPTGTFSLSPTRTSYLYLVFNFGFDDAADQDIREAGLYIDTVVSSGLPSGQTYFTPDDIEDPGTLLLLEHFPVVTRSQTVRQSFEFVLSI